MSSPSGNPAHSPEDSLQSVVPGMPSQTDHIAGKVQNAAGALVGGFSEEALQDMFHDPFPKGTEVENLPEHVIDSWTHVQELSPEKRSKISYYEKNGEWCIIVDGTKIPLQNAFAPSDPDTGINVVEGNAYFSQSAALAYEKSNIGQSLPTKELWTKMADFLGGFNELRDILQIPLTGWFHPDRGLQRFGSYAGVWSGDNGDCLHVFADGGGVDLADGPARGNSVRLLDK